VKTFHVVLNIPSPYRVHLLEVLNRQLREKGVALHVHFMARGHAERPKSWLDPKMTFAYTYWKDYGRSAHHFNPSMIAALRKAKPDYLLLGSPFDTFTGLCVSFLVHAKSKGVWIEGNTQNPGKLTGFIGGLKRAVLKRCGYVAVPGTAGRKYIDLHRAHTTAKLPPCIVLPNLIDETRFVRGTGSRSGDKVCLVPSRLSPEKGVLPFVKLLDKEMLQGWKIVIMGKGVEEAEVVRVSTEGGFREKIEILDYVPYDEMPKYYASSDLVLLPSLRDQNPLAVVEALHCGLPIALTDRAGNVDEALDEGKNGWALPVNDAAAFKAKLKQVFATDRDTLKAMGDWSYRHNATFWNSDQAIARFVTELGL